MDTAFTRPDGVTGTGYTDSDLNNTDSIGNNDISFTYPIYYIITDLSVGESNPPLRADFITGSAFRTSANPNRSSVLTPRTYTDGLNFTGGTFPELQIDDETVTEFTTPRIWIAVPNNTTGQQNNQPDTFRIGQVARATYSTSCNIRR